MDDRRQRFEALALPHMDAAYNLARWLSRSPVEADDIVQDAMLRAFSAFDISVAPPLPREAFTWDNAWKIALCSSSISVTNTACDVLHVKDRIALF